MRILIVSQYFYPETFMINEIATGLVKRGHSVDVVTGIPNYPKGEIYEGYENRLIENYCGVTIFRTRIRPRHTGSLNLFLNYMSFMKKAKKTIRRINKTYDIVFCYEPSPIFQLTPTLYAKKRFKCSAILMCCDQWPESLKARGLSKGFVFNAVSRYCIKNLNKCDFILNIAPSFVEYNHRQNKVPYSKMNWIIQPSNDFYFDRIDSPKNTIDIVFAGNIGTVQNVEQIITARSMVKHDNLIVHIFGDGSEKAKCVELVDKLQLNNKVLFYGKVDQALLRDHYRKMDACLLTLSGKSSIGNTIPSKFANYLSLGLPIIAAIGGDCKQIIENNHLGLCCPPDDTEALADLMNEYCERKDFYASYGEKARSFFLQNCSTDVFLGKLELLFSSFCNQN